MLSLNKLNSPRRCNTVSTWISLLMISETFNLLRYDNESLKKSNLCSLDILRIKWLHTLACQTAAKNLRLIPHQPSRVSEMKIYSSDIKILWYQVLSLKSQDIKSLRCQNKFNHSKSYWLKSFRQYSEYEKTSQSNTSGGWKLFVLLKIKKMQKRS